MAKIKYTGGWQKAYADQGKELGFTVESASGNSLSVWHGRKYLGLLTMTREMDLAVELPRLYADFERKQAAKLLEKQAEHAFKNSCCGYFVARWVDVDKLQISRLGHNYGKVEFSVTSVLQADEIVKQLVARKRAELSDYGLSQEEITIYLNTPSKQVPAALSAQVSGSLLQAFALSSAFAMGH